MSNLSRCCDCSVPYTGYPPVEIWATPDAVVTVVLIYWLRTCRNMSNPWRCCDCSVPNTGYAPVEIWATPDAVVTVVFLILVTHL